MSWLANLKIGHKLALGFGVCLALDLISGVVALDKMKDLNSATTSSNSRALNASVLAQKSIADFRQYRIEVFRSVFAVDKKELTELIGKTNHYADAVDDDFTKYGAIAIDPVDKDNLLKYETVWKKCRSFEPALFAASANKNFALSGKIINIDAEPSYKTARETGQAVVDWNANHASSLSQDTYSCARLTLTVLLIIALAFSGAIAVVITRLLTGPIHELNVQLKAISAGAFHSIADVFEKMSRGDFSGSITSTARFIDNKAHDELGQLCQTFNHMLEQGRRMDSSWPPAQREMATLVTQISRASDSIASATAQLASGNEDLSARTSDQASSLEETAASMEEMTSLVKQSAENAVRANKLAVNAGDIAKQGGAVASEAIEAMSGISDASKRISEIVSVIDDIAFQTNLLALNAAVEAARVGEQGKGFAVVAGEVRTLAQRSSKAAKEIKDLVKDSAAKVQVGTGLVNKTGEELTEIVSAVENVSRIIADIANASQEQAAGIEQVNQAVVQMDEITQQNAALVEEATATSEAVAVQADGLKVLLGNFTIDKRLADNTEKAVGSNLPSNNRVKQATGTHGKLKNASPELKLVKSTTASIETCEF